MTIEELERLAIGIETGYRDRYGTPIKVGDDITLYHRCKTHVDEEEVWEYPKEYIIGTGFKGYVYTGKIVRQHFRVTFSFHNGLEMTDTRKYGFLYETDSKGNLICVVVGKDAPKLTFEDLLKGEE